jgi:DNA-directed RNA polymerase subunit N (RpoN/RPB10)
MLYPVCPTCGFCLADKELLFKKKISQIDKFDNNKNNIKEIFEELKVKRYCCRMRLITYIDLIELVI